ncbi:vWA domain-containing protein [Streptomyces sp. JNUCC 64]
MSRRSAARKKGEAPDPAAEAFAAGLRTALANPALAALEPVVCRGRECREHPGNGLCAIDSNGVLHVHPTRRAAPETWAWAVAHCVIHLGFGHVPAATGVRVQPDRFDLAARCAVVARFQETFPCGRAPDDLPAEWPGGDEEQLAARWRRDGLPAAHERCGTGGTAPDQLLVPWPADSCSPPPKDWRDAFARALTRGVSVAMDVAGGRRAAFSDAEPVLRPWDRAREWFVSSYPLLGGVAAGMTVVADAELARAHDIAVAAVNAEAGQIYVNPLTELTEEEWRFVLAHQMLHAALRHGERLGGRDPYLFNVAADHVVNGWLREMAVGEMPAGLPHDPDLAGLSAEEVYDRIAGDPRRSRRLSTPRGKGRRDVLGAPLARPAGDYADLDEFYRRALVHGFDLHDHQDRGRLPAGLVEEIRALSHPPPPWDVRLARWFDEFVPRPEPVRGFARPARRQASTPDIPRAGRWFPPEEVARHTFGVLLGTSESMDRTLLGKALGAVASYATARDVPAARVVFCGAAPYDAGYLPVEEIAGRVRITGRGGPLLQPGVDLLARARDFPRTAPLLVVTDGHGDVPRIRREHAYLVPEGAGLPFRARGPVFRVR